MGGYLVIQGEYAIGYYGSEIEAKMMAEIYGGYVVSL